MSKGDDSTFAKERNIYFEALGRKTEESRARYLEGACGGDVAMMGRLREMLANHHGDNTMKFMVARYTCPLCERPIPSGLPQGLCPRCVFDHSMETLFGGSKANGSAGDSSSNRCQSCEAEMKPGRECPLCPSCMLEKGFSGDAGMESLEIKPGKSVAGHEIVRRLGIGGMGIVYEARQKSLRRSVALKMIRAPSTATPEDIARFQQEAEAAARLNHPNIVEVYEIGEFEGTPYFTMKYVEGARTLGTQLAQGSYEPEHAAKLLCEIARAVGYAHQRGVIHRDIKPANILIDDDGSPHLVDFGLAKLFGQTPSLTHLGRSISVDGKMMGTPYYMSPEQIDGEDLTTSTDVYSLGVVLYELLAGQPPFTSNSLKEMLGQISQQVPPPPTSETKKVPRDLQVICLKCLRKEPKNRYGTANELARDLERWLEHRPIHARPPSAAGRMIKWVYRNPWIAGLSIAVAVLAIITTTLLIALWWGEKKGKEASVEDLLVEAENFRVEKRAGRRWDALETIGVAAKNLELLDPGKTYDDYRKTAQNEAIWSLSLIDLRQSKEPEDTWSGNPAMTGVVAMRPDFSSYAHTDTNGTVVIRERPSKRALEQNSEDKSGKILHQLENADAAPCRGLRFNSSDGLYVVAVYATGNGASSSTVWDVNMEKAIRSDPVNGTGAVDFSADGSIYAFASGDKIQVVPFGDDLEVPKPTTIHFAAGVIRLSPDGTLLAASPIPGDGARVFDCRTGEQIITPFKASRVLDMEWNPLGRQLAMGCNDGRVVIWDTQTEKRVSLQAGRPAIEHVAWHPRGVLVAGSSSAGAIHLWHVAESNKPEVTWQGDSNAPRLQFSQEGQPGGTRLGTIVNGKKVSLFEVAEGRVVSHASGHPGKIYGAWWRGPGLGRLFSTAGDDGVRIWNRRGFEKAFIEEPEARAAIFTKTHLIISGKNGVSFRPVSGGSLSNSKTVQIKAPKRIPKRIPCFGIDFYEDDKNPFLAVATGDHVLIYNLPKSMDPSLATLKRTLKAPPWTTSVDISPDGKWVAAGAEGGGGVRVWDVSSWGKLDRDFPTDESSRVIFYRELSVEENEDGIEETRANDWFVISSGREYRFYEVDTWTLKESIPAKLGKAHGAISFSPRNPVFAASEAQKIRIHSLNPFDLLMNPEFVSQEPVCFSPAGFILMTADQADQRFHLHLWDLRLLRESLKELNLDVSLRNFPPVPEPLLIEEVIVGSEEE